MTEYMLFNGKKFIPEKTQSFQFYRQPHDTELVSSGPTAVSPARNYRGNANGTARDTKGLNAIPQTFRLTPDHQTPLNCDFQQLIRDCNPLLKDDCVDDILDQAWILANNTGIGIIGRKNCRTGEYMNTTGAKWPAFHTPLWCGGALGRGTEKDGLFYLESILTSNPVPSVAEVIEKYLYFYLTEINSSGVVTYMTLAGKDGRRHPITIPFITRLPIVIPLAWLHKLTLSFNPETYDPRKSM